MNFSIIIPACNEEGNIETALRCIEAALNKEHEVVVVNDHSHDNTAAIVGRLSQEYNNIRLVDNDDEPGFANALKTGFNQAKTGILIPVMADLCDAPDTINKMYEKSREGFDIVCGSRYMQKGGKISGPVLQSFFSTFVGKSLKYLIGIPTSDVSNSFKSYRKSLLDRIQIKSQGFEISMEITLKSYFAGAKITEIPTIWKGRFIGKSKFYLFKAAPKYIKLYLWAIFRKMTG
jgi:glycosyltransferase involved in cell wall biosynthesis